VRYLQTVIYGNVIYRLKTPRADGTTHVILTPHAFLSEAVVQVGWHGQHVLPYGTVGRTASTSWAAVSAARLAVQLGHCT
jgi:hypothetical protein